MEGFPQHSATTPNPSPIVQNTPENPMPNPVSDIGLSPTRNPNDIPTHFPSVGYMGSGSGSVGFDLPTKKRGRPRKYGPPDAVPQNPSANANAISGLGGAMVVFNEGSRVEGGGSGVAIDALAGRASADGGAGGLGGAGGGSVGASTDGGAGGLGGAGVGSVGASADGGAGGLGGAGGGSGMANNALGGAAGVGITPHVLMIKPGEDIFFKLMAFLQEPRTFCILSANGGIGKARIKISPSSEYTVTYEGHYEILSLQGSFTLTGSDRIGDMKVTMSGPAGCVIGGAVSGMLVAGSPVQVFVCSFPVPGPGMLNFDGPPSPGPSVWSSNENAGTPK